jgi:ankyrin repeat protein
MDPATEKKLRDILRYDKVDEMKDFIRQGGDVNIDINTDIDIPIKTKLIIKALSLRMVKLLVESGADIHSRGPGGITPLLMNAGAIDMTIFTYLLSLDPNLIKDVSANGDTALHLCVKYMYPSGRSLKNAKIILEANPTVDINYINKKGFTALDLAIQSKDSAREPIIKLLIDNGAVRNDTTPSQYDASIKEYKASKKIGKFMKNVKSKRNTLRNAWQPGGEAYEALKNKVNRNGAFSKTRKSRKSKTRKSRK